MPPLEEAFRAMANSDIRVKFRLITSVAVVDLSYVFPLNRFAADASRAGSREVALLHNRRDQQAHSGNGQGRDERREMMELIKDKPREK